MLVDWAEKMKSARKVLWLNVDRFDR